MVRPCFFFRAPDIAPRTLCGCQFNALVSWVMVAPSDRRSIASIKPSLEVGLGLGAGSALRGFAVLAAVFFSAVFFCLVVVGPCAASPAEMPALHATLAMRS